MLSGKHSVIRTLKKLTPKPEAVVSIQAATPADVQAVKKTEVPTAQAVIPKPAYGVTFGGIKGLKSNAKERIEAAGKNKQALEINQENLQAAWNAMVDTLTTDKVFFRSAIHQGSIVFEGHLIHILVFGVAYDFLKNQRLKLLDLFKHHYQNDEINVLIIDKPADPGKMAVQVKSTKEIFEEMADKNPVLRKLKDNLGMDFDY